VHERAYFPLVDHLCGHAIERPPGGVREHGRGTGGTEARMEYDGGLNDGVRTDAIGVHGRRGGVARSRAIDRGRRAKR